MISRHPIPFLTRRRGRRQATDAASVATLPTLDAVKPLLALEIARARRHSRSLSIVSLPREAVPADPAFSCRLTDLVVRAPGGRLVVIAPETSGEGIADLARRLTGDDDPAGAVRWATFPDDALTFEALLEAADL